MLLMHEIAHSLGIRTHLPGFSILNAVGVSFLELNIEDPAVTILQSTYGVGEGKVSTSEPDVFEPADVRLTTPTKDGQITLSGTVSLGNTVESSFDGDHWLTADASTATGNWDCKITLPKTGETTIRLRSKKGTLYSASSSYTVTFTVPAPTLTVSAPTSEGKVNLSGTDKRPRGTILF